MPSRTLQAAISTLPAGATALFEHNALYTLAALVLCPVLAVLPDLADTAARWRADTPRRDREQIGNQALSRIGQTDPERVMALLARLPPLAHPFEREPSPAEGPAPEPGEECPPGVFRRGPARGAAARSLRQGQAHGGRPPEHRLPVQAHRGGDLCQRQAGVRP